MALYTSMGSFENKWKSTIATLLEANKLVESSRIDMVLVYKSDDDQKAKEQRDHFFSWIKSIEINMNEIPIDDAVVVELNVPLHLLCQKGSKLRLRINTQTESVYKDAVKNDYSTLCFCMTCFKNDNFSNKLSIALDQEIVGIVDFVRPSLFRPSTRSLLTYYILNSPEAYGESKSSRMSLGANEGLNFMLERGYLEDAFLYHEIEAELDKESYGRNELEKAWKRRFKYLPVNMIRNYFGEHIAMYFAWCEVLTLSLWIPMVFGVITFFYGYIQTEVEKETGSNRFKIFFAVIGLLVLDNNTNKLEHCSSSYGNVKVPGYHIFGTSNLLKTMSQTDPNTGSYWLRIAISSAISLLMICLVFIVTAVGTLLRVIANVDGCKNTPSFFTSPCFLISDLSISILTSVSIIVLRTIYHKMAISLTEWENYRTNTEFNNALIVKLFAFCFANSYTACFYLAFFRRNYGNGLFGLGSKYNDSCEDSCMPLLSMQIMSLMLIRPIPKFCKDILLPYLKKIIKKCKKSEVYDQTFPSQAETEYRKEPLSDFTMDEYSEKVVLYGYLMLFAASFPFAPLIAMVTVLVDLKIDMHRLLYIYKRPIPFISEDIGMWLMILDVLNEVGVLVNACLIAFTSDWGKSFTLTEKLTFVLLFENFVFVLKKVLGFIIPDVPKSVKRAKRMDVFRAVKIQGHTNANINFALLQDS